MTPRWAGLTRATFWLVGGRQGYDLRGCGRGGLFGVTNRVVGSLARGLVHPEGAHGLGCEGGADRAQAGPAGRRDRAHRLRARRQPARGADGGRPGAAPARPGRLKKLVQTLRPPRTVTIDTDDHTITAKPQLSENAEQILAKLPPIAGWLTWHESGLSIQYGPRQHTLGGRSLNYRHISHRCILCLRSYTVICTALVFTFAVDFVEDLVGCFGPDEWVFA